MKVKALKKFEGIQDLERGVFPKEGDVWETTAERAELLLKHGVVEFIKEKVESITEEDMTPEQKESFEELKKEQLTEKALEKRIVTGTIDYDVPENVELKVEMRLEDKPKKKKTSKK